MGYIPLYIDKQERKRKIYFKELAHMIMDAEKSEDCSLRILEPQ
jgi:hypothetical protein